MEDVAEGDLFPQTEMNERVSSYILEWGALDKTCYVCWHEKSHKPECSKFLNIISPFFQLSAFHCR